ncbi:MAG: hypothetical protein ABW024_11285 [Microbacterium sp.]
MSTPSPTPQQPSAPTPAFAAPQPYAGQPTGYVLPTGYPAAGQPQGRPTPSRSVPGLISLILGIVLIVWMFVNVILQAQAIATGGVGAISALGIVTAFLNIGLALAAIGLGIAGIVSRSGSSKVAAGIGTGIGAMALAGSISGLLYPVLFDLFGAF